MDKGMFPVMIYKYIKENSDEDTWLTPEKIYKFLRIYTPDIQEESTWKTVSRNLEKLADQFEEIRIVYKDDCEYNKTEKFIFSEIKKIYYNQRFTTNDVRIISDAVIYSRHLNDKDRKDLLGKIAGLWPSHSNKWYSNALQDSSDQIKLETDLFHNLDYIDFAIREKSCINFDIMSYGFDKKLHPSESHEGFTPYKIYIADGIYYVVGLLDKQKKREDHFAKESGEREPVYPIRRFPIHRMKRISLDEEHKYVEIKNTVLKDMSLKDICEGEYNWADRLVIPWNAKGPLRRRPNTNDVQFLVSKRGIDALADVFGKKLSIQQKRTVKKRLGSFERTDQRFEVTLKNASSSDWNKIVTLLMKYMEHDIALLSHHSTLNRFVVRLMSHNVQTIE